MDDGTVRCTQCGAARDKEFVNGAPTAPCTACGSMAVTVALTADIRAALTFTGRLDMEWSPAPSGLAWLDRWKYLCHERATVTGPPTERLRSAEAVHRAEERLTSFMVMEFHLRDCLISDRAKTGIARGKINKAIKSNPTVSLLADVANTVKHVHLNQPPWSGSYPTIGQPSGTTADCPEDAWRLNLPILHDGKTVEAADLARVAMDEWWTLLCGWGLPAHKP
jgi:hypothetical protein